MTYFYSKYKKQIQLQNLSFKTLKNRKLKLVELGELQFIIKVIYLLERLY